MNTMTFSSNIPFKAQLGFTLVELITVLSVIGIIGLAILPKLTDRSGFSEFAMQKRFVSALQNIQLKAMYDTRNVFCYQMVLNVDEEDAQFGPSTAAYTSENVGASCSSTIDNESPEFLRTNLGEIANESLIFSALDSGNNVNVIGFDNSGRPSTNEGTCASGCVVAFTGESTAAVCVESEGYIYAC